MTHIVIAPNSFKGTLSAAQAAAAIAEGVRRVLPAARLTLVPLADGGEGTLDTLVEARGGVYQEVEVCGPLGDPVRARYGLIDGGGVAVIEMAQAAGLLLVPPQRREVMRATTFGVGELIRDALDHGIRRLLIGVGGSATNDCGAGCAQALGVRMFDADDRELPGGLGGGGLGEVARTDVTGVHAGLRLADVEVLCDVRNPLVGPDGAAYTYAPQKGATPEQVAALDANLVHFARIVERDVGVAIAELEGAGAAGGLGAGLHAFAGGKLRPGAETVIEHLQLVRRAAGADAIITGEGCFDAQSLYGKAVMAVAELGVRLGAPVFVLAGAVRMPAGRSLPEFAGLAAVSQHGPPADMSAAFAALSAQATRSARLWFASPSTATSGG